MERVSDDLALKMLSFPSGTETEVSVRKREDMVVQCCLCKRIRDQHRWVEEPARGLASENVSHGYCPTCAAKAFAEVRAFAADKGGHRKAASL